MGTTAPRASATHLYFPPKLQRFAENTVPKKEIPDTDWLSVIGRTLAYLCLEQAKKLTPDRFKTVRQKVDFLLGMGLPEEAAAYVAGNTPASVAELARQQRKRSNARGKKNPQVMARRAPTRCRSWRAWLPSWP